MRRLVLTRLQWEEMRHQVAADAPLESCGLLAGRGDFIERVLPVPNALNSETRYRFDPYKQLKAFEQIEQAGLDILAIYHSHPNGPRHPSPTDINEAHYSVVYVIWSREKEDWQASGFWIEAGAIENVAMEIIEQLQ
jgi:proteasome lid subunit RPN8/RPN11